MPVNKTEQATLGANFLFSVDLFQSRPIMRFSHGTLSVYTATVHGKVATSVEDSRSLMPSQSCSRNPRYESVVVSPAQVSMLVFPARLFCSIAVQNAVPENAGSHRQTAQHRQLESTIESSDEYIAMPCEQVRHWTHRH